MRRAVYAASFDPPTLGHIDIIRRAAAQFNELHVVIMQNPEKPQGGFFTVEEREQVLLDACKDIAGVWIIPHPKERLLVEFCRNYGSTAMIRGLRAISDFDYEFKLALANKSIAPEVETFFLMAKPEYSFISSSMVRDMAKLGANISELVTPLAADIVKSKL